MQMREKEVKLGRLLTVPGSQPPTQWQISAETPEAALEVKRAKAIAAADRSADSRGLFYCTKTSRMKRSSGRGVTEINGETFR